MPKKKGKLKKKSKGKSTGDCDQKNKFIAALLAKKKKKK